MKVADLEGVLLDYWVAKAEGRNPIMKEHLYEAEWELIGRYSPSTNWAQGGEIIERERLTFIQPWDHGWEAGRERDLDASGIGISFCGDGQPGPTMLIAAMRAYVASKFGDTVEDS